MKSGKFLRSLSFFAVAAVFSCVGFIAATTAQAGEPARSALTAASRAG